MRIYRQARLAGRVLGRVAVAMVDTTRPLIVQIVPMRRCNLACAYCNEYDATSRPVPLPIVQRRLDRLAELGTAIVTISGGEPLMHPDLDAIVAHIRARDMVATLITNGYLLSPERIHRLNDAGLEHLQISIDNVEPDAVSKKSLRLLEPKLRWLAEHARFEVNINSVLGSGIANPEDALAIAARARELGFTRSVGLLNGAAPELALMEREMAVYRALRAQGAWTDRWLNSRWQDPVAEGRPIEWKCRAGARYLYVDEDGLVHYCSRQRGNPAIPLDRYTKDDIRREFDTAKPCASTCTVNCVQQASLLDGWRGPQGTSADHLVTAPA